MEQGNATIDTGGGIGASAASRVLVMATDGRDPERLVAELQPHLPSPGGEVLVVAPAVEETQFQHALGDADSATAEARRRLDGVLAAMRQRGLRAVGEVGDSDLIVAAEDAMRRLPVDEILIVAHTRDQARWFEDGLFERASKALYPPVRMVTVRFGEDNHDPKVVDVERAGAGRVVAEAKLGAHFPGLERIDAIGMTIGVLGTIIAIVLAAAGPGPESTAGAIQILVAMAVALVNMAHVVGLVLLDSAGYHGGWQRFFRTFSAIATPTAVIVNLILTLAG